MNPATVARVTKKDDDFIEFVFKTGDAFQRRLSDLDLTLFNLLHANLDVFVQSIDSDAGSLVTGLFIPEQGWVFQMSSQDLADYTKRLSAALHAQRQKAQLDVTDFCEQVIANAIYDQVGEG